MPSKSDSCCSCSSYGVMMSPFPASRASLRRARASRPLSGTSVDLTPEIGPAVVRVTIARMGEGGDSREGKAACAGQVVREQSEQQLLRGSVCDLHAARRRRQRGGTSSALGRVVTPRARPSSFRQNATATNCVALPRKGYAPSIVGGTTFRFVAMLCEARLRFDVSRRLAPSSGGCSTRRSSSCRGLQGVATCRARRPPSASSLALCVS
jgi:hypothetical protein